MPLYLHLFHGRADPSDVLTDWGTDGPTIGPFDTFHATYCNALELWHDEISFELGTEKSLIHFDGVFYGDLEISETPLTTPVLSLEEAEKISRTHQPVPSQLERIAPVLNVFLDAIRMHHGDELARRLESAVSAALR